MLAAWEIGRTRHSHTCMQCQKVFDSAVRVRKFCSVACRGAFHKAEKNARYNPDSLVSKFHTPKVWTCRSCGGGFTRTTGQRRCTPCLRDPKAAAPFCSCGCGEKTTWSTSLNGYPACKKGHQNRHLVQTMAQGAEQPVPNNGRDRYVRVNISGRKGAGVHRLVMEAHIGRRLLKGEVVHHKNCNRRDNNLANLFLFHCARCHTHHHYASAPLCYIYSAMHPELGLLAL